MINFVVGPNNSGKTTILLNKLIELSQNRIVNDDILFIQPSFEAVNNLISESSLSIPGIEIVTFKTLSNKIISDNSPKLRKLEFGNSIFLEIAFEEIFRNQKYKHYHDLIKGWRNTTTKSTIHNALTDLIRENINSNFLSSVANETNDTEIHNICKALSIILENYFEILHNNLFYDEAESEVLAAKILREGRPKYRCVFVDNFNRFTQGQNEILKAFGKNTDIYLTIDTDTKSDSYFVKYPNMMLEKLIKDFSQITEYKIIELNPIQHNSKTDLDNFRSKFLYNEELETSQEIQIIRGESPYYEISRIGIEIRNLVSDNLCSFEDIAILYRSNDPYSDIIPNVLTKCGIPYNNNAYNSLRHSSIIRYVLNLEEILNQFMNFYDVVFSENKLMQFSSFLTNEFTVNLIKCELDKDVNLIEMAKLNDNLVESGLHSFKLIKDATENDQDIESFVEIKKKFLNQRELEVLSALLNLFESYTTQDNHIINILLKLIKSTEQNNTHASNINKLIDVYNELKNVKSIPFVSYMKEVTNDIIETKQSNNLGVICGNVATVKLRDSIKAVFIVGLNQNKFPVNISPSPIINDNVRNYLWNNHKIDLQETFHEFEDYLFYKTINMSSNRLYLSYSEKDLQGTSLNPSTYLYHKTFNQLLQNEVPELQYDRVNIPGNYDRLYLRTINASDHDHGSTSKQNKLINKCLSFIETDESVRFINERLRLTLINDVVKYGKYSISRKEKEYLKLSSFTNKNISKSFENEEIIFSHSSLKNYLTCPYKFLNETIFKIKEKKKFKLDASDWGNLFHNSMEFFAYQIAEFLQESDFSKLNEFKVTIIENVIRDLRTKFHKSYLIYEKRLKIRELEKQIDKYRKFLESEIDRRIYQNAMPVAVELAFGIPFSDLTKTPIVIEKIKSKHEECLEISNGNHNIRIRGFIDLVDEIEIDGENYYLIIDYKKVTDFKKYINIIDWMKYETFEEQLIKEEFSEDTILPILNFRYFDLQIPIYLLAIKKVFNLNNAKSGLFYHLFERGFAGFIEENIVNKLPNGFFEIKPFKAINTTFTNNEIDQLLISSEKNIINIVENMKSGIFPITPDISHPSRNTVCDYCPYTSICRVDSC